MEPLDEIAKTAAERRSEFVKNFRPAMPLMEMVVLDAILETIYNSTDFYSPIAAGVAAAKLLVGDVTVTQPWEVVKATLQKKTDRGPELDKVKAWRALTAYAYYLTGDNQGQRYHDYNGKFRKNPKLNKIYDFLGRLGYAPAEEEMRYINGTHELFN